MLTEEFVVAHYNANYKKLVKRYSGRFDNATVGEEVVQEAYCRLWMYREAYNPMQPFENWFNVICFNVFCTIRKEEKGHPSNPIEELEVEGIVDDIEYTLVMKEIEKLISQEVEWRQEILDLFFIKGYKVVDIVKMSPRSYGSISMCVKDFRKKLKELFDE